MRLSFIIAVLAFLPVGPAFAQNYDAPSYFDSDGRAVRIAEMTGLHNVTCVFMGIPALKVLSAEHGKTTLSVRDLPIKPDAGWKDYNGSRCSGRVYPTAVLVFTPDAAFSGKARVTFSATWSDNSTDYFEIFISVKRPSLRKR